ncbi:glycosyltransferase family 2 protein [Actinomadura luteofluorescens]|uniref:glycosyltransferase family 2 protein n=1 Tax=Actinomadura luteofluorescens TaxID=46163 RepID=UPI003476FDB0
MRQPLVSVIVPVYQCRDTVGGALESVFAQTLPAERVEVIAVDDGSTDGGGELLDELARAHERLTVVHQPNSGGAGAPRNRGLELASGTFVFFLDADDRLGPEALERMTAMAERNGTDIVLGKQVGTGGRKAPKVFDRSIERTHVFDPDCDLFGRMSMAALQLFRRSLVERAGLRFTEGLVAHEDQLFTAGAYLNAGGVSVLADYDCYYWAAREDGSSATQGAGAPPADLYAIIARAMRQVADHTEPGETRERLNRRYLRLEVFGRLDRLYLDSSPDDQKITLAGCRELLEEWYTPAQRDLAHPLHRVIGHCVLHDLEDELVEVLRFRRGGSRPRLHLEDGRAYLKYPFFRDAAVRIPDACFASPAPLVVRPALTRLAWEDGGLLVGGTVVVRDVDEGSPAVRLLLEDGAGDRRPVECEIVSAAPTGEGVEASFTAAVGPDAAALPDGRWTLRIEVSLSGHVRTVPLVKPRDLPLPRAALAGTRLLRPLQARAGEPLALEAGAALTSADFGDVEVGWGPGRRVRVRADAPPVLGDGPAMSVLLHHADDGTTISAALEAAPDDPSRLRADLSLAGARPGRWRARFAVDGVGEPVPVRLPAEGGGVLGPVTASVVPPRRVHVRMDRRTATVQVTAPVGSLARRTWRRLLPGGGTKPRP